MLICRPKQLSISQVVPAVPAVQWSRQLAPGSQVIAHAPPTHVTSQSLSRRHATVPSCSVASQTGFPPSHSTEHGGVSHSKMHAPPGPHVQVPFAHRPVQAAMSPHETEHGGASHEKRHWPPGPHVHDPSAHAPLQVAVAPHATEHGGASHSNSQRAPSSQVHAPFAQLPLQSAPGPHDTSHGGASHVNAHAASSPHVHSPFAHAPVHDGLRPSQVRVHGGASHGASQLAPTGHVHTGPSTSQYSPAVHAPDSAAHATNHALAMAPLDMRPRIDRRAPARNRGVRPRPASAARHPGRAGTRVAPTVEPEATMDIVRLIAAIFVPPLGVFLQEGLHKRFWINVLLTLLGYFPGLIHAVYVIAKHEPRRKLPRPA